MVYGTNLELQGNSWDRIVKILRKSSPPQVYNILSVVLKRQTEIYFQQSYSFHCSYIETGIHDDREILYCNLCGCSQVYYSLSFFNENCNTREACLAPLD